MQHINLKEGVDICGQDFALRRFIEIVKDHAKLNHISFNLLSHEYEHKYLKKDYKKINNILGTNIEDEEINQILKKLGFKIDDQIKFLHGEDDIESKMT